MRLTFDRRAARAWAWRLRWVGAALLAGLALRIGVPGVVAAFQPYDQAVVLAHAVTAGATLEPADLALAKVPKGARPPGVFHDVDAVVGARAVAGLPAGLALVPELVTRSAVPAGAPQGTVAAPVRLSDPAVAGLLRKGDRVDVMAATGSLGVASIGPAQVLAQAAQVLDVPGEGLVLLAVTPAEAKLIAGAAAGPPLTATLVG